MKKVQISKRTGLIAGISLAVIVAVVAVIMWQVSNHKNTAATSKDTSGSSANSAATSSDGKKPANSQSSGSSSTSKNVTNQPATPAGGQTASTSNSISINDQAFSPASITVKKGTAVTWTNNDSATHAIDMADDTDGPHSPQLHNGQSYTYSFSQAGTYKYICVLHPDMHGTVVVTD